MSDLVTEWSEAELLASAPIAEPLVARGVRCHGGIGADGEYVSPRTRFRIPAVAAWQQAHRERFGTEIIEAPLDLWPETHPNVARTKYLIAEGVRDPAIAMLTRIGTVEGFGGLIRAVDAGDMQQHFADDVAGTALAHLQRGLFEAHARDEAGHGEEAGHDRMWFAIRDIAFEDPVAEDMTRVMLERMGISTPGWQTAPVPAAAQAPAPDQRFPELDPAFEAMLRRMIGLLLIEVSAFHTFAWAEAVVSDGDLVAESDAAARLVRCIRADETVHVDYLRTALTEVRDRTVTGPSGRRIAGSEVIATLWETALAQSLGPNRAGAVRSANAEILHALADHPRRDAILEGLRAIPGGEATP